jgi:hypothetical protein
MRDVGPDGRPDGNDDGWQSSADDTVIEVDYTEIDEDDDDRDEGPSKPPRR